MWRNLLQMGGKRSPGKKVNTRENNFNYEAPSWEAETSKLNRLIDSRKWSNKRFGCEKNAKSFRNERKRKRFLEAEKSSLIRGKSEPGIVCGSRESFKFAHYVSSTAWSNVSFFFVFFLSQCWTVLEGGLKLWFAENSCWKKKIRLRGLSTLHTFSEIFILVRNVEN